MRTPSVLALSLPSGMATSICHIPSTADIEFAANFATVLNALQSNRHMNNYWAASYGKPRSQQLCSPVALEMCAWKDKILRYVLSAICALRRQFMSDQEKSLKFYFFDESLRLLQFAINFAIVQYALRSNRYKNKVLTSKSHKTKDRHSIAALAICSLKDKRCIPFGICDDLTKKLTSSKKLCDDQYFCRIRMGTTDNGNVKYDLIKYQENNWVLLFLFLFASKWTFLAQSGHSSNRVRQD